MGTRWRARRKRRRRKLREFPEARLEEGEGGGGEVRMDGCCRLTMRLYQTLDFLVMQQRAPSCWDRREELWAVRD